MKFKLKETSVEARGETFVVRELTHAERSKWLKEIAVDQYRGPSLLVALGAVNPTLSEDDVNGFPGEVVNALFTAVLGLSAMTAEAREKKSDAG